MILLLVQLTISDLVAGATDDLFFGLAASAAGGPVILLLVQLTISDLVAGATDDQRSCCWCN